MAVRQVSILELCVSRVGVHRGALAASYVARYAMTQQRLGKFPTALEYADDWAIIGRAAWDHRRRMQEALGDDWPAVVECVAREIDRRQVGLKAAMQLRVPSKLAGA